VTIFGSTPSENVIRKGDAMSKTTGQLAKTYFLR
jgi:hypothetical protein